jgi:hypothetical protein
MTSKSAGHGNRDERYAPSEAEPAYAENSNEEYANGLDGAWGSLVNDRHKGKSGPVH